MEEESFKDFQFLHLLSIGERVVKRTRELISGFHLIGKVVDADLVHYLHGGIDVELLFLGLHFKDYLVRSNVKVPKTLNRQDSLRVLELRFGVEE